MLAERAPLVHAALTSGCGPLVESAPMVLGASGFVLDALCRDPALWDQLQSRAADHLGEEPLPLPELASLAVAPDDACLAALRRWRRAEFTRMAWRDLAGWAGLDDTLGALSRAAELAVRAALGFAVRALAGRFGQPRSPGGELQSLVIVAMGKLGGGELNFSSDIDLVLLYPEDGATDGPEAIANQEYFTRLAQRLVHAARRADRGRLRVPGRHAAAAVRRQRPGGLERGGARGLPADPWPRLGALRVGQGAPDHCPGRLRTRCSRR